MYGRHYLSNTFSVLVARDPADCLGVGYRYSRDIAAAWEVVEKLGGRLGINRYVLEDGSIIYGAKLDRYSEATTAPLAVCRAALKAVSGRADLVKSYPNGEKVDERGE